MQIINLATIFENELEVKIVFLRNTFKKYADIPINAALRIIKK